MKDQQYSSLASVYNDLNFGCDYQKLSDFLVQQIRGNEKRDTKIILDLACGTGVITLKLREKGYDMIGIDLSEEMLSVAREECYERNISDVLWLCQDMTDFELFGTIDACVCCLDSINYLTSIEDVKKCFSLVYNYLVPNGIFVFDINTPYRFENVYANNDFVIESGSSLCAWQNSYNKKSKLCHFYLSIFQENDDGTYTRSDETQTEKCYSYKQIQKALSECGFEIISVYGDSDGAEITEKDEKWYFTVRCIKDKNSPNYCE